MVHKQKLYRHREVSAIPGEFEIRIIKCRENDLMLTPSNTIVERLHRCSHLLWEYAYYLFKELRNPLVYLTSAVIGVLAIWLMKNPSLIPFIVPFVVQIAVNAILKFKHRDIDTLLLLPGQRKECL